MVRITGFCGKAVGYRNLLNLNSHVMKLMGRKEVVCKQHKRNKGIIQHNINRPIQKCCLSGRLVSYNAMPITRPEQAAARPTTLSIGCTEVGCVTPRMDHCSMFIEVE